MKANSFKEDPNGETEASNETPIRVLCVDDEHVYLDSTKQILELQSDFYVETASSVNEAQQKMQTKAFDVIVSDYQMPEKNGLDFLKEIRENGSDIPFILFTGKGREEVAIRALNLGVDRYFSKIGHPETVYGELAHGIRQAAARRRAEKKIWDREERLRAIFTSSPDAMTVTDMKGNITDCNLATIKLMEISSKKEILGYSDFDLIAPEDAKKIRSVTNNLLENGIVNSLECKLLTKKGHRIPIEFSAIMLKDAYGQPIGTVALARNITERKKADQELRKSEEKYRNVVELSPDGIATMDLKGTITSINQAVVDATGFSKDEIVGKHFTKLRTIRLRDVPKYAKLVASVLKGKKRASMEFKYLRKDGTERLGEAHISLLEEKGKKIGLQAILRDITEAKQVEQELKDSEEKYRVVVEQAPDAIITFDSNGVVTSCNPAGLEMLGFSKEEILGKSFTNLSVIRKVDTARVAKEFSSISNESVPEPFVVDYVKNGKQCFGEVHLSLMKKGGKIAGFQANVRDITEHKKAEESLRESEKRFRELSELLPEIIFETDINGTLKFANHEGYVRFGYSKEEFESGLNILNLISPDCVGSAKQNLGKLLSGETTGTNEYTALTKGGTTFPVLIKSTPIFRGKNIVGIRGMMMDITSRKVAEDDLKESEEKFRTLAEQSPNMIFINYMGKVIYANPRCEEIMGYTREEFYSPDFDFLDLISPEHRELVKTNYIKHLKGEVTPSCEYTILTKNGKQIDAILTTRSITYHGQIGILGTITDITERKKTEDKLKETLTKLECLNEKLSVVGKFTRHDTRNKLSTIANNAYLAKLQLKGNPKAAEYLAEIEQSIDQIEKIFEFSRIYEILGTEKLSDINVKQSIDEAFMLISRSEDIELFNKCEGITVLADSLLRQIFYNMIDNSQKHGEKVTQIQVSCNEEKDNLKIIYEDNGIGIPEDQKELIFKEGYGKGTGYGLYLIRKICDEYGWTIKENSSPKKGARFEITIPKLNKNGKQSYTTKN
jgi:PAS domain S-box-containing protein